MLFRYLAEYVYVRRIVISVSKVFNKYEGNNNLYSIKIICTFEGKFRSKVIISNNMIIISKQVIIM